MCTIKKKARKVIQTYRSEHCKKPLELTMFEDEDGCLYESMKGYLYLCRSDVQDKGGRFYGRLHIARKRSVNGMWIYDVYPVKVEELAVNRHNRGGTLSLPDNDRQIICRLEEGEEV